MLQPSQEKLKKKKCLYNIYFFGGGGGGGVAQISFIMGNVEVAYGRIALAVATVGSFYCFFGIRDFPCLKAGIRSSGYGIYSTVRDAGCQK